MINLSTVVRYYAVLLVLYTAYSFVGYESTLNTASSDSSIIHLSMDNGEISSDQPTDTLPLSTNFYQGNKYHAIRTFDKQVPFVTLTRFASNPRAPPII